MNTMPVAYRDRTEAGRFLARKLAGFAHDPNPLVLAISPGGVPVAFEVARALGAPLDVFLVRKLGVPGREQPAMGDIASGGVQFLNDAVVGGLGILGEIVEDILAIEWDELRRREWAYRGDRPAIDVRDRTVLLVDDGLATGSTLRSAVAALRHQRPLRLVVALPIVTLATCDELRSEPIEVVCARPPEPFHAVDLWYEDLSQTTDEEVRDLLRRASGFQGHRAELAPAGAKTR